MEKIILEWLPADIATLATIASAVIAALTLAWIICTHIWPQNKQDEGKAVIANNGGIAVGGGMSGSKINIDVDQGKN